MALIQSLCTSFKSELMLSVHDFRPTGQTGASVFKIALYTSAASLDANTTAYTTAGEVTGANYTAGGKVLTNLGVSLTDLTQSSGVGYTTFADVTWSNVSFTARGALIYNSTPKAHSNSDTVLVNPAVCVLDFGSDITPTSGNFTISFPSASNSTAIVRVS